VHSAALLLTFFSTFSSVTSFLPSATHCTPVFLARKIQNNDDSIGKRKSAIVGAADNKSWDSISQLRESLRFDLNAKKRILFTRASKSSAMSSRLFVSKSENQDCGGVDFDSLMDMDVVLFSRKNKSNLENNNDSDENLEKDLELGAIQEDGTLAPISAWTLESAFSTSSTSDSIEFLVDEEDRFPGLTADDVVIHTVLDETLVSYGSRQVGGGKGPGNPHGEESELLYYVERSVVEEDDKEGGNRVNVVIKPELEILW